MEGSVSESQPCSETKLNDLDVDQSCHGRHHDNSSHHNAVDEVSAHVNVRESTLTLPNSGRTLSSEDPVLQNEYERDAENYFEMDLCANPFGPQYSFFGSRQQNTMAMRYHTEDAVDGYYSSSSGTQIFYEEFQRNGIGAPTESVTRSNDSSKTNHRLSFADQSISDLRPSTILNRASQDVSTPPFQEPAGLPNSGMHTWQLYPLLESTELGPTNQQMQARARQHNDSFVGHNTNARLSAGSDGVLLVTSQGDANHTPNTTRRSQAGFIMQPSRAVRTGNTIESSDPLHARARQGLSIPFPPTTDAQQRRLQAQHSPPLDNSLSYISQLHHPPYNATNQGTSGLLSPSTEDGGRDRPSSSTIQRLHRDELVSLSLVLGPQPRNHSLETLQPRALTQPDIVPSHRCSRVNVGGRCLDSHDGEHVIPTERSNTGNRTISVHSGLGLDSASGSTPDSSRLTHGRRSLIRNSSGPSAPQPRVSARTNASTSAFAQELCSLYCRFDHLDNTQLSNSLQNLCESINQISDSDLRGVSTAERTGVAESSDARSSSSQALRGVRRSTSNASSSNMVPHRSSFSDAIHHGLSADARRVMLRNNANQQVPDPRGQAADAYFDSYFPDPMLSGTNRRTGAPRGAPSSEDHGDMGRSGVTSPSRSSVGVVQRVSNYTTSEDESLHLAEMDMLLHHRLDYVKKQPWQHSLRSNYTRLVQNIPHDVYLAMGKVAKASVSATAYAQAVHTRQDLNAQPSASTQPEQITQCHFSKVQLQSCFLPLASPSAAVDSVRRNSLARIDSKRSRIKCVSIKNRNESFKEQQVRKLGQQKSLGSVCESRSLTTLKSGSMIDATDRTRRNDLNGPKDQTQVHTSTKLTQSHVDLDSSAHSAPENLSQCEVRKDSVKSCSAQTAGSSCHYPDSYDSLADKCTSQGTVKGTSCASSPNIQTSSLEVLQINSDCGTSVLDRVKRVLQLKSSGMNMIDEQNLLQIDCNTPQSEGSTIAGQSLSQVKAIDFRKWFGAAGDGGNSTQEVSGWEAEDSNTGVRQQIFTVRSPVKFINGGCMQHDELEGSRVETPVYGRLIYETTQRPDSGDPIPYIEIMGDAEILYNHCSEHYNSSGQEYVQEYGSDVSEVFLQQQRSQNSQLQSLDFDVYLAPMDEVQQTELDCINCQDSHDVSAQSGVRDCSVQSEIRKRQQDIKSPLTNQQQTVQQNDIHYHENNIMKKCQSKSSGGVQGVRFHNAYVMHSPSAQRTTRKDDRQALQYSNNGQICVRMEISSRRGDQFFPTPLKIVKVVPTQELSNTQSSETQT